MFWGITFSLISTLLVFIFNNPYVSNIFLAYSGKSIRTFISTLIKSVDRAKVHQVISRSNFPILTNIKKWTSHFDKKQGRIVNFWHTLLNVYKQNLYIAIHSVITLIRYESLLFNYCLTNSWKGWMGLRLSKDWKRVYLLQINAGVA